MVSQGPMNLGLNLIFQKETSPIVSADKEVRASTETLKTGPLTMQRPTGAALKEDDEQRHNTMHEEGLISPQNESYKLRKEAEVPGQIEIRLSSNLGKPNERENHQR